MQESRLPRGLLKRLEETKEEESDTKERLETRLAAAEKRRQAALLTRQAKAKQLTSLHIMHGLRDCKPSEPCLACTPDNLCFLHQPKMPASHTRAGFAYSLNVYDEIQEILPRMYLGNYWAAGRRDIMRNYAISHVLTVGNGIDPPEMGLIRKQLSVEDCRGENLLNHMCEAIRFIDEGRGLVPSSNPSSAPAAPPPPPSASPPSSPVSMFVSSSVTSNNADISVEILEGSKSFPHEDLSPAPHSCTSVNLENHVSTEQQPTNACNIEIAPSPAGPSSSASCSSAKYPPAINPSNNPLPASSPTSVSVASSPTAGSPASAASSPASVSVTSASPASVSTASSPTSASAASSPASPSPASSPASVSATSSPAPAAGSPRPSPANPAPSEPPDRTLPAVFIHCAAGVSRSATVCIAYCMLRQKMTYEQAHAHVLKCRPVIRPNIGFVSQLKMLEETDGDIERAARSWRQWRDSDEDF